ncbi:MAG: ATP-binding protein [Mycobacteriaceae bacterium]
MRTDSTVRSPASPRRPTTGIAAPPRVSAAVTQFMLGSLAAIAVIMVGGFFALRSVAIAEATRDTTERVRSEARLVETAGLDDGIMRGDPSAIRRLDDLVRSRILGDSIVRVKLWKEDGTILYSDEPALIGQRYALGDEDRELFATHEADAELSDLDKPENRFERGQGKLLEAYTTLQAPDGTTLLFEMYQRFSSIGASGSRLLHALAPPLIAGMGVLLLFQVPLAWTMARRLQRGHRERERLLANAIAASTYERQRIAADLHDGVVQDLAGVAFGLAPLAAEAQCRGNETDAGILRAATTTLRRGVRELRTLLLEIHPPNLEAAGLRVALSDLLSPLEADGIATTLDVDAEIGERLTESADHDALVYRVAREALRNAQTHAKPSAVTLGVTHERGATRLLVTDDGVGFTPADRLRRGQEGHVGLTLLTDVVAQAGGILEVRSTPGTGTTVALELPP